MKVKCAYCESYVEADENMKCPLCNAPLGVAAQAVQEHEEELAEAERQYDLEAQTQEAKDTHIDNIIKGVTSVATALAGASAVSSTDTDFTTDDEHRGRPPLPPDGRHPREGGRNRTADFQNEPDWMDDSRDMSSMRHRPSGDRSKGAGFLGGSDGPSGPGGPGSHDGPGSRSSHDGPGSRSSHDGRRMPGAAR